MVKTLLDNKYGQITVNFFAVLTLFVHHFEIYFCFINTIWLIFAKND